MLQALLADLAQAANLDEAVHVTSTDGVEFTTTYTVTLSGAGAITGAYTDAAGRHVLVTAPGLVAGSRVRLYSVTDSAQLLNADLAADGLTLPITWASDKVVELRADKDTKSPLRTLGVLTSSGLSFLDLQADDPVYVANAIDGSTVTEFSADGPNIQIDINDPDGITSVQRLYAWLQWYQTTSAGIASVFFGAMKAIDSTRYVIDQTIANILLDNIGSTPVRMIGGTLERADGSTVIAASSNSIQIGTVIKVVSAAVITVALHVGGIDLGAPLECGFDGLLEGVGHGVSVATGKDEIADAGGSLHAFFFGRNEARCAHGPRPDCPVRWRGRDNCPAPP